MNSAAFQDKCKLVELFPPFQYIFWNTGDISLFNFSDIWLHLLVSAIWFVGPINQIANTLHIWKETSQRLAPTEQLFVNPMYNAALIDQSLVLNRRCLKVKFTPGEKIESVPAIFPLINDSFSLNDQDKDAKSKDVER